MVALCPNCHAVKTRGRTRQSLQRELLAVAELLHRELAMAHHDGEGSVASESAGAGSSRNPFGKNGSSGGSGDTIWNLAPLTTAATQTRVTVRRSLSNCSAWPEFLLAVHQFFLS